MYRLMTLCGRLFENASVRIKQSTTAVWHKTWMCKLQIPVLKMILVGWDRGGWLVVNVWCGQQWWWSLTADALPPPPSFHFLPCSLLSSAHLFLLGLSSFLSGRPEPLCAPSTSAIWTLLLGVCVCLCVCACAPAMFLFIWHFFKTIVIFKINYSELHSWIRQR